MRRWHVVVSCTVRFRLHLQPGDRRRGLGSASGVHSSRTGPGDPAHHHSGLHEFPDYLLRRGSHGRRQCVLYSQGEEGETGPHSGEQRHTEAGFGGSVTACNAVFCACFPCLAISQPLNMNQFNICTTRQLKHHISWKPTTQQCSRPVHL